MSTKLCYKYSDKWHAVPKWIEYFISIGEELALEDFKFSSRIIAALVVPTRAYCASLVGFGMVVGDTIVRDRPSKEEHFNKLLSLDPGTPVIYHETDRNIRAGVICRPEKINGEYFIKFQILEPSKKGGEVFALINQKRSLLLHPSTHPVMLPKRRAVKDKIPHNEFVSRLLPGCDLVNFDMQSKFVCGIVGKKNILEQEIGRTPFAVDGNGSFAEGSLQDVLRVNIFTTGAQPHRSVLISTERRQPRTDIVEKIELGVVLDGADAFLRWGAMFPNCHQVIILDRTELHFYEAVHSINSAFSQDRIDIMGSVPFSDITPPAGLELLAFREGTQ